MDILLTQEQTVTVEGGSVHLVYELLMSHFPREEGVGNYYGIRIRQYGGDGKSGTDDSEVRGVTESYAEAESLLKLFARETVMPVHLFELVDDWQTACAGS